MFEYIDRILTARNEQKINQIVQDAAYDVEISNAEYGEIYATALRICNNF